MSALNRIKTNEVLIAAHAIWSENGTSEIIGKEALTILVNRLAKEERLSGIYIGSC